jgi:LPS export ABC transporter protein LptC
VIFGSGNRNMNKGIVYILICCMIFTACENSLVEIEQLSGKRIAVEEAKKIESFFSQGGKMRARLTAPVMNRYLTDSPYIEFPKSLHVDFYDSTLTIESQLSSKYGRYKQTEQKVFLRDSVVVFNIKRDTLRCQELWWDQNSERFYTDKPVQIHQPDKIIFGKGLEADQSFKWYILKEITGELLIPKGGFAPPPVSDSLAPNATLPSGNPAPLPSQAPPIRPFPRNDSVKPGRDSEKSGKDSLIKQ